MAEILGMKKYIAGKKFTPDQLGYKLKIIPPG
jgi:hypothetical protein